MNKNTLGFIAIAFLLCLGGIAGVIVEKHLLHKSAIAAGVGQYNPQTGAFEWIKGGG